MQLATCGYDKKIPTRVNHVYSVFLYHVDSVFLCL